MDSEFEKMEKECGVKVITFSENGPEIFLEYRDRKGQKWQASAEADSGDPIEAIKSAIL